MLINIII